MGWGAGSMKSGKCLHTKSGVGIGGLFHPSGGQCFLRSVVELLASSSTPPIIYEHFLRECWAICFWVKIFGFLLGGPICGCVCVCVTELPATIAPLQHVQPHY